MAIRNLLEGVPQPAVDCVAGFVKVPAVEFAKYDLTSRSATNHRQQIREALKFRPATRADEEKLMAWLAAEMRPVELVEDRLREALLVECRARTIEPPGRIDRIVTAARTRAEKTFCAPTIERLGLLCGGPAGRHLAGKPPPVGGWGGTAGSSKTGGSRVLETDPAPWGRGEVSGAAEASPAHRPPRPMTLCRAVGPVTALAATGSTAFRALDRPQHGGLDIGLGRRAGQAHPDRRPARPAADRDGNHPPAVDQHGPEPGMPCEDVAEDELSGGQCGFPGLPRRLDR